MEKSFRIGLALAACAIFFGAPGLASEPGSARHRSRPTPSRAFDIRLADGRFQRLLYSAPGRIRASLVMLPGGSGDLGLESDGRIRHGENFLVRTRRMWFARGFATVIPDRIGHASLRGVRSSPAYAAVVATLVQFARARASQPVFLIGASQGSIAAANGAARSRPGSIDGVILTETVSRLGGSGETIFDADLRAIRTPALLVANRKDLCPVAPPEDAPNIAAAMIHSEARVLELDVGEDASGRPCGSRSAHGYFGADATVVDAISHWIESRLR